MNKTSINLKYDHYAVTLPDGKYVGPYKTWAQADLAKGHHGGKYIVKCTGIGELQPFERADGTLVDLGTVNNPKPLDFSAPLKLTPKENVMPITDDTAGSPIFEPERTSGRVTYTAAHAQVDAAAEERVKRHQAHVEKFGIAMAPPLYAPGFVTEKLGGENFHISHTEHKGMPRTLDGLQGIRDAVKGERRRDLVIHPQRLRMTSSGLLYREDGARNADGSPKTIVLEDNGLRQLCARLNDQFPRAADFLKVLDPADRAEAFNKQIVKVDKEFEIKARTRTPPRHHAVGLRHGRQDLLRVRRRPHRRGAGRPVPGAGVRVRDRERAAWHGDVPPGRLLDACRRHLARGLDRQPRRR